MGEKLRLDSAIFEKGFCDSREKAKTLIMAGVVYVNNQKADKCGMTIKPDDIIEVRSNPLKYVSRGGLKLEKAIDNFGVDVKDAVCISWKVNWHIACGRPRDGAGYTGNSPLCWALMHADWAGISRRRRRC